MAVPTVNVTCTVTNQTGAVVAGATVTAQLTGIDVYGTNYIFPNTQSFVTDVNGLVTMPLFPNALGARRTAYQFIAIDPVTGRALINITAVVPNQNIDLSVLDAINKLPAYAPPLSQPYSGVLTSLASSAALFSMSQLVPAADQMMYFSGPNTALLASLTAFGRSLVAAANAAAAATTLGLGTGNSPSFAGVGIGAPAVAGVGLSMALDRTTQDGLKFTDTHAAPLDSWLVGLGTGNGANALQFYHVPSASVKLQLSSGGVQSPILTASTSVVTPLVASAAGEVVIAPAGASRWRFDNTSGILYPTADNTQSFGLGSNRISNVFTSAIDSGTTGSLSLRTNNGTPGFGVISITSAINYISTFPNGAGGRPGFLVDASSETNTGLEFWSKGTGPHLFKTGMTTAFVGGVDQFSILHTASANQNPTATGGNGVNSKIGTTAGGLDFTSATIRYPNIGTTANAANAALNAVGSNDLLRSTSSKRYKTEIEALSRDEAVALLRKLNPITYASLSEHDDPYLRHSGFIAEEVFDINPLFVSLSNKRPESVQYERLTVPLVAGWQDHDTRLAALEARIH